MLRTHYAAAIGCARGNALDEIMRKVWTRYGKGEFTDDEAGEITTLAHERRAALRGSGQGTFSLVLPPPPSDARRQCAGIVISGADRRAGYGCRRRARTFRRS